jgi:hypothetical protein
MKSRRVLFLATLSLLAAASRLVPHPSNFTPLAAVALFGAATFPTRWLGAAVPLGTLFASDVLLQLTYRAGWQAHAGFYRGQWVVYACCVVTILLGFLLRRKRSVTTVGLATLAGAVVFFLATNFVWAYGPGSLYPRTIRGLLLSYEVALPFFRNSLAADFVYAAALFGSLALAEARFPSLRNTAHAPA